MLFVRLMSNTPHGAVTVAVLTMVPEALEATVAVTVYVKILPDDIFTVSLMFPFRGGICRSPSGCRRRVADVCHHSESYPPPLPLARYRAGVRDTDCVGQLLEWLDIRHIVAFGDGKVGLNLIQEIRNLGTNGANHGYFGIVAAVPASIVMRIASTLEACTAPVKLLKE